MTANDLRDVFYLLLDARDKATSLGLDDVASQIDAVARPLLDQIVVLTAREQSGETTESGDGGGYMSAEPPATKDDGRKGDVVYGDFRDDRGTIEAMELELGDMLRTSGELSAKGDESINSTAFWYEAAAALVRGAAEDLGPRIRQARDQFEQGEMSAPPTLSRKDDGRRDYQAEIAAARAEFEGLWDEARALTETPPDGEEARSTVLQGLYDISRQLSDLSMTFPISDWDAMPIPEGRELLSEIAGFQVWIDEQYAAIQSGDMPMLMSNLVALERAA